MILRFRHEPTWEYRPICAVLPGGSEADATDGRSIYLDEAVNQALATRILEHRETFHLTQEGRLVENLQQVSIEENRERRILQALHRSGIAEFAPTEDQLEHCVALIDSATNLTEARVVLKKMMAAIAWVYLEMERGSKEGVKKAQ